MMICEVIKDRVVVRKAELLVRIAPEFNRSF